MKHFTESDFRIKKHQIGVEYITKREKLAKAKPMKGSKITIDGQIFNFYYSERMPLTGQKYTFINHKNKNIATFW